MTKQKLSQLLLDWYAQNGRDLPWRFKGGAHPNPYAVLVSEIMLQQTTVKTVMPYFERFMQRFPMVASLAEASIDEVYLYWQGLGYYSRARSLHASAQMIVNEFGGQFPQSRKEVEKLKGIGAYTAASFLALAFNLPETVVDGNVIRIICRLYHLTEPVDDIMPLIRSKAQELTDRMQPADYASAIMDLGAVVCTPKNPKCLLCPWHNECQSKGRADLELIPQRKRTQKKEINGFVYIIRNSENKIFIRQRTEKGLLSGLYEFPWNEQPVFDNAFNTGIKVNHIFTHIRLELQICLVQSETPPMAGQFVEIENLSDYALSALMRKVERKAFKK